MRDQTDPIDQIAGASPGNFVWIRQQLWRVRATHSGAGLTRVMVDAAFATGRRTFLLPAEHWEHDHARSPRDVSGGRALAWLAACAGRASCAFTPSTMVSAATTLLAYQFEPALAILAGSRRVLIADGVGLGKTVQAALIIAETMRRRVEARVLVLVPAPLVAQWSGELKARFDITALSADAAAFTRLRADRPYLNNPWQGPGVWLASPDYLKQPHVMEAIPRTPFDLVVIDEAHTLAGNSQRRAAIGTIARSARHVVLLTATPHDGDDTRFKRLLSLGETGSKADVPVIFRRARTEHVRHVRTLDVNAGPSLSRVLNALDSFERTVPVARRTALHLICAVFRKRALSSMAAFLTSLDRRMSLVNGERDDDPTDEWEQLGFLGADLVPDDERAVMRGDAGLAPARERMWLQRLHHAATSGSVDRDPKLERLRTLLRRAGEPAVVFTEYRDTLLAVAATLTGRQNVAVLHGGLTSSQQRLALRAYADGQANTLLATDVASQGLNLQHRARWVINFDLPWTPMRLEQRVGRVDRIGQTRLVHVTVLGIRHRADAALRARVAARQDVSDAALLVSCTRWTRAADGLARWFGRQRAMAARWRGPDPIALPRARVPQQLIRRLCGVAAPRVAIVEIPIVCGTGEVIERHLGWITCGADSRHAGSCPPPALVRRARALSARVRRRLAREHAAQAVEARTSPRQPGLFDARDLPQSRVAASDGHDVSPADVRVGEARLRLILEARS